MLAIGMLTILGFTTPSWGAVVVSDDTACVELSSLKDGLSGVDLEKYTVDVTVNRTTTDTRKLRLNVNADSKQVWTRSFEVDASDCSAVNAVIALSVETGVGALRAPPLDPPPQLSRYKKNHLYRSASQFTVGMGRYSESASTWGVYDGTGSPYNPGEFAARIGDYNGLKAIKRHKRSTVLGTFLMTAGGGSVYGAGLVGMLASMRRNGDEWTLAVPQLLLSRAKWTDVAAPSPFGSVCWNFR